MSLVRGVRGQGSGSAEAGTTSTIVFHHSTFRSGAGEETDSAAEGVVPAGDHRSTHLLETPMVEVETKVVGNSA